MPSLYRRLNALYGPPRTGPTRREMLKLTIAGAAGLLLTDHIHARAPQRTAKRVLIVGGGFSGLAAAHELHAAGYDVEVFEARNRLGGRVLSFHDLVPGKTVEGGAELIGSNHPTWGRYKEHFKLDFIDVTDDESSVMFNGVPLGRKEAGALLGEMNTAYSSLNAVAAPVDAEEPWKSPDAENLDRGSVAAWVDAQPLSPLGKHALHAEFEADNGVLTAWQSQLGNLTQIKGGGLEKYWEETEVFRCKGGNNQLAYELAGTLPAGKVHLRAIVTKISVSDTGATVTLADGKSFTGDDVILAAPPSVWHKIAIAPVLPPDLRPQMGSNVKYLVAVKSRFWERAGLTPNLLSDGPVLLTWEGTDAQKGPGAALTAFSGGASAEECREWRPAERANRYLRTLEKVYRDIPREFVKGRFMDWPGDAWTRASYSFPAPGQLTSQGPRLRAGVGHLHFAGEHTCPKFVGYMEGALDSGVRIARHLANRDGLVKLDTLDELEKLDAGAPARG
jgi:monoamine oxidase